MKGVPRCSHSLRTPSSNGRTAGMEREANRFEIKLSERDSAECEFATSSLNDAEGVRELRS